MRVSNCTWETPYVQTSRSSVPYYSTGEEVAPGIYSCTFCGSEVSFVRDSVLPLCPICDSAEFVRVELDERR